MIPSFHDGYLVSIAVGERRAVLGLKRVTGETFTLTLEGVEALQADDFRQGNIISSVEITCGQKPPYLDLDKRLERLFPSPNPNPALPYWAQYTDFLNKLLAQIESREAAFINITSSYGCDLVAVCRTFTIAEMIE